MKTSTPKVVILCGGMGTRLKEETEFKPKPMVEIAGKPILWHIMKIYASHGFKDFVLCLGYKGEIIKQYFLNYEMINSDITVELGSENVKIHNSHQEKGWQITLLIFQCYFLKSFHLSPLTWTSHLGQEGIDPFILDPIVQRSHIRNPHIHVFWVIEAVVHH